MALTYVNKTYKSYEVPELADKFLTWFDEKIKETGMPLNQVRIVISAEDDYGSHSGTIELQYSREETGQEKQDRLKEEKRSENWERRELNRLNEKYGRSK